MLSSPGMKVSGSLLILLLIGLTGAGCARDQSPSSATASEPNTLETGATDTAAPQSSDPQVWSQIRSQYQMMRSHYEGLDGDLSPELRRDYDQMQQGYEQMMSGMGGRGMMGSGGMMTNHDNPGQIRQMLELHQQMARLHQQEGDETMARMHEQMVRLYEKALSEDQTRPVQPQ